MINITPGISGLAIVIPSFFLQCSIDCFSSWKTHRTQQNQVGTSQAAQGSVFLSIGHFQLLGEETGS